MCRGTAPCRKLQRGSGPWYGVLQKTVASLHDSSLQKNVARGPRAVCSAVMSCVGVHGVEGDDPVGALDEHALHDLLRRANARDLGSNCHHQHLLDGGLARRMLRECWSS